MEKNTQKIIEFTRELVAVPSQNGIDSEREVADLVSNKLKSFGFTPEIIGPAEHPSVICHIKKENSSKTIWLQSCLDTVVVGDISKWEHPSFGSEVAGNKMYGRGIADSKIGIAIFCYLAKELAENQNFNASIFLGFDADEQSGNFTGVKEVMARAPKSDLCILGYQGISEISIGARGWLRLKIATLGRSAHTGSRNDCGINAIHAMGKVIDILTSRDLNQKKEPFFEFGSSLNISQISGGTAINIVPDRCEVGVDVRLLPSQTREQVLGAITDKLNESGVNYELEQLQHEPPYLTNPKNDFVLILQKRASEVLGKEVPLVASGQGSVGNVINPLGVPIINTFGVESANVHAPNEWIGLDSVPKVFEIYKKALIKYVRHFNVN